MLFLLSPAKSLDFDPPPKSVAHTQPLFVAQSAELIDLLKAQSPQQIATFTSSPTVGPVDMGYQFDALHLGGSNKKYVKKEIKRGYHVAAVRVTNNWDRELNFSRDLVLQSGERPAIPVPATAAAHDLTIVTRNTADFKLTGVRVQNPW